MSLLNKSLSITYKSVKQDFLSAFSLIAEKILNGLTLCTPRSVYRICEIEFYYFSQNHPDPYCHKNERQLLQNRLYFHRFKNPGKYPNLKQKGMDITFGHQPDIFAGILLRTILDLPTGKVVAGPAKIINRIIPDIGGPEFIKKIHGKNLDVFDPDSIIQLRKQKMKKLKIHRKPRIGLTQKTLDKNSFFLNAPYNYFIRVS